MRNRIWTILLAFLLAAAAAAHDAPKAPSDHAPKGGWQETSQMELSFAATRIRIKTRFERENFQLKHEIPLGNRGDRLLMLWERNGKQVLVMLWRLDVNQTGYSIGEIKDDRN